MMFRQFGWVLACFVVMSLAACEPASPPAPQNITLAVPKQPTSLLVFVALEQHLFEKQGLKVDLKFYPSGKRALKEGLLAGQADLASAMDAAVSLTGFEHPELRVLASMARMDDIGYIVARADRGIQQPADLRGRTIATQSNSGLHFFLHQFLLNHGINDTDVKFRFEPLEDLPQLLAQGGADAVSIREPYLSECLQRLGERAKVFKAPGIYEPTELLVSTDKWVAAQPAVFQSVLKALLEAEANMPDKAETARIITRYLGASEELMAPASLNFAARVELSQALLLVLEEQARWAVESRLVVGDPPNFLRLLAPATLESLAPDRVTLIH